jgi:protoheme IX farnesyltransferase
MTLAWQDALDPEWAGLWEGFIYQGLYTRNVVDDKTRILCMVGNCVAVGETVQSLAHMRGAMRLGASPREVMEVILQSSVLLITTYGGLVIGGKEWPSFSLTIWTLLGGALAASGSSALNQYIDRELDKNMVRTAKRPLADGRLTHAEGLAFGLGLSLVSYYILASFVNSLAALLSLAGIIYYVILYSVLLKKATVQNIVIGGGAGAIPPLVGYAAATGNLDLTAWILFAIIFMWTPPHFWALAIVRMKDYENAGVPMMPVIRGELETRRQILVYTIELVIVTLLLPILNLAGTVYLVSSLVLGGALLYAAWMVWRHGGNKLAWRMYKWSSSYLVFIFFAIMVDAVLR